MFGGSSAAGASAGALASASSSSSAAKPMDAAEARAAASAAVAASSGGVGGSRLVLTVMSTWGDHDYFGLAGLELLDEAASPISLRVDMLKATPADLNELHGGMGEDKRTVDKLIDGVNATTDSDHMWLAPWQPETGRQHTLTISLPAGKSVAALRVWNYNKSEDDSHRGIRQLHIRLDDQLLSPPGGLTLRKGPGNGLFDHAQLIPLVSLDAASLFGGTAGPLPLGALAPPSSTYAPLPAQDYWAPVLPQGLLWRLRLLSTWGDVHYIGLDALQLFDENGVDVSTSGGVVDVPQPAMRCYADPADVNSLPDHAGNDPRTVDKLFRPPADYQPGAWAPAPPDGRKAPSDVWLAPHTPGERTVNELWVSFEQPICLSLIRLRNYSKDPARGVHEFELLADGMLVYRGWLKRAGTSADGSGWQSIVLTDHPHVLEQEGGHLASAGQDDLTLLINEGKVMNSRPNSRAPPLEGAGGAMGAPTSSSTDPAKRPTTACAS